MKITAACACSLLCIAFISMPAEAQEPLIFRDATEASGILFNHIALPNNQRGMGMNTGAAWLDFDRDSDLDLYITQGVGSNALYRNNGDGTFTNIADSLGASDPSHIGAGVAVGDYNNDGWPDLFLANANLDVLLENQEGKRFVDVTDKVGILDEDIGRGTSASWGDFNNDGFLDLYVTHHFNLFGQVGTQYDRLYMNNQGQSFTDVSHWLGLDALDGHGFIGTWTDFDNDNDLDLFVVNDCGFSDIFHTSKLFRNDGSSETGEWRFTDVSEAVGADHCQNGMGIAVGDYDRDGMQEYFYTNIGERTLLLHYESHSFYNTAERAGVFAERPGNRDLWTWGANFFDYDLDGWLDLYVAAGTLWLQTPVEEDPQPNLLFRNNGDGTFENVTDRSGVNTPKRSRTPVYADYDQDGDVDLYLVNSNQEGYLFENRSNNSNHFLIVDLEGVVSNRDGIGSKLKLTTPDGISQYWETRSGSSLGGGDDRAAYFGLGSNSSIASLEIVWPSGVVQTIEHIQANQRLLIKESVVETNTTPHKTTLSVASIDVFPNPFVDELYLHIQTDSPARVTLEMYDILGRLVIPATHLSPQAISQSVAWHTTTRSLLSDIPAGLYIIRAVINEEEHIHKHIVKR